MNVGDPLYVLPPKQRQSLELILTSPPLLHYWRGRWRLGGFKSDDLRQLVSYASRVRPLGGVIAETGAGLSTLALLCLEPTNIVSIAPDGELFARITTAATEFGLCSERLMQHIAPSELVLPSLVLDKEPFIGFALIDGGHNFTQVWVDFVYFNYGLHKGGIIAVDDVQLFPCQQLCLYLNSNAGWELVGRTSKTIYFRKKTDRRLERDFGSSEFIVANSLIRHVRSAKTLSAPETGPESLIE